MANDNKLVNLADLKEAFDNIPTVSQSAAGLMSADDKTKLDEAASYKVIGPESVVSVSDAVAAKAGKVVVNIEPLQAGSGDPSPTNVRPISGWTGANVVVSLTTDAQDGTTYPISWQSEAGTVYGGTLDVTTGLLTVDRDAKTVLPQNITKILNDRIVIDGSFGMFKSRNLAPLSQFLCSNFKHVITGWDNVQVGQCQCVNDVFGFRYTSGTVTIEEAKSYVQSQIDAGTPIVVCAPLKTPVTYQLTPTEVDLLLGDNNVWADAGDITVGYLREDSLGTGEAIADAIKNSDVSHGQMVKAAMTKTFNDAIEVTTPTFSTLPKTFSAVGITPDHELVQDGVAYLSNLSALGSDWTINTGDNEIIISGTCNDSTYVKLSFCVKQKTTATA